MGVTGLWDVVASAGRRVRPETLEGRTMAIDSSIWMVQFMKGMRDINGNMVRSAHLIGFFRRICKLLYYRIRPVFVFDGPPPALKLATLMRRKQFKEQQEINLKKTAERLLLNRLKQRVVTKAAALRNPQVAATPPVSSTVTPTQVPQSVEDNEETFHTLSKNTKTSLLSSPESKEALVNQNEEQEPFLVSKEQEEVIDVERTIERLRRQQTESDDDIEMEEVSTISHKAKALETASIGSLNTFYDDVEVDTGNEALANAVDRRARRAAYYNSIPSEFTGFLAGRRRLDDIQIASSGIENLLAMPQSLLPKDLNQISAPRNPHPQASKMFRQTDDFKEYRVVGEDGEERYVQLPLDSEIDPEVFKSLPPKMQYSILTQLRDAWVNNTRLRAVQAKDDSTVFSNIQVESFLRQVRTTQEIEKVKKAMAKQVHAQVASSISSSSCYIDGSNNFERNEPTSVDYIHIVEPISKKAQERSDTIPQESVLQLPASGIVESLISKTPSVAQKVSRTRGKKKWVNFNVQHDSTIPLLQPLKGIEAIGAARGHFHVSEIDHSWNEGWSKLKSNPIEAFKHISKAISSSSLSSNPVKALKKEYQEHKIGIIDDEEGEDNSNFDVIFCDLEVGDCFQNLDESSTKRTPLEPIEKSTEHVKAIEPLLSPRSLENSTVLISGGSVVRKKIKLVRKKPQNITREENPVKKSSGSTCSQPIEVSLERIDVDNRESPNSISSVSSVSTSTIKLDEAGRNSVMGNVKSTNSPLRRIPSDLGTSSKNITVKGGTESTQIHPSMANSKLEVPVDEDDWGDTEFVFSNPIASVTTKSAYTLSNEGCALLVSSGLSKTDATIPITEVGCVSDLSFLNNQLSPSFQKKAVIDEVTSIGSSSKGNLSSTPSVPLRNIPETITQKELNSSSLSASTQPVTKAQCSELPENVAPELPEPSLSKAMYTMSTSILNEETSSDSPAILPSNIAPGFTLEDFAAGLDEEAADLESKLLTHKRDADTVTHEMQQEVRQLLRLFGLPYIDAPAEAEAQCAVLTQMGLCEAVISDDSDALVFGAAEVFRRFFDSKANVEMFELESIHEKIGLTRDALVLMALLLGCDYTVGVHGIGIVNALEAVKVFNTFDSLVELKQWATDPNRVTNPGIKLTDDAGRHLYKETHKRYRYQWTFPPIFPDYEVWQAFYAPKVDRSTEPFTWGTPDLDGIINFLSTHAGLLKETVMETLNPVLKQIEIRPHVTRQSTIKEFFKPQPMTNEDAIAKIRSKRMKKAIQKTTQKSHIPINKRKRM